MSKESSIVKTIINHLKDDDIWYMKIHGGAYQPAGMPDLLVLYRGIPIFVEVKVPYNKPTVLQVFQIARIKKHGGISGVVHDWDDMKEILDDARMLYLQRKKAGL